MTATIVQIALTVENATVLTAVIVGDVTATVIFAGAFVNVYANVCVEYANDLYNYQNKSSIIVESQYIIFKSKIKLDY